MNHSFNIEIAKNYGIEAAIILENLAHWTHVNLANNHNIHDGKIWIYNSRKAWNILFPYIHERTIGRVLDKLEADGILISGNYNQKRYDRTKWYAFSNTVFLDRYFKLDEKALDKLSNGLDKMSNASCQSVQPIPVINTVINTDINNTDVSNETPEDTIHLKTTKTKVQKRNNVEIQIPYILHTEKFMGVWSDWVKHRREIKAKLTPTTETKQLKMLSEYGAEQAVRIIERSIQNGWRGLFPQKEDAPEQETEYERKCREANEKKGE